MDTTKPDPMTGDPPGVDRRRLTAYLDRACPELGDEPVSIELITGGKSNLTYRVTRGATVAVLRRPPLGHVLPTAHDMTREYQVIAALHPAGFAVPAPLRLCTDTDIIGAPFYLMSYVDGVVLGATQPLDTIAAPAAHRCSQLLVTTLAALHRIDPVSIGLSSFGRPDGFRDRQVRRWHGQWERSKTRELASLEKLTELLADGATQPGDARPSATFTGIVHGDYRIDNVMFDAGLTTIRAVLDWEMATVGDPLTDLGLLVVYTELAEAGLAPTLPRIAPAQGFASASELVSWYADAAGTGPLPLGWYVALGYYKLAVVSEGIHARYLRGKTVGPGFEHIGAVVPDLVDRGRAALAAW